MADAPPLRHESWTAPVMGSMLSVHVRGAVPGADVDGAGRAAHDARWVRVDVAVSRLVTELRRLEGMFSTFLPGSEVSRHARGELAAAALSPEVTEVLGLAAVLEAETDGAFAAHRPGPDGSRVSDPTGLVKGWAVERVAAAFDDELASDAARPDGEGPGSARRDPALDLDRYVGIGGDLDLRVARPEQPAWRVGVADPARPGEVLATLGVRDGAVATSGTAERGTHLWDPRTGGAADAGLASVTVVGRSLAWADAIATALFVAGEAAVPRWTRRGYRVLTVRADGTLTRW